MSLSLGIENNNLALNNLIKDLPDTGPFGVIASIVKKCKGKNAAASLSVLASYLNHDNPGVRKAAAAAIALIIVEIIPRILDDPTLTAVEKKQIAQEICEVFDEKIAPKMGVFYEVFGGLGKIIAKTIYHVIADLQSIANQEDENEKKKLLFIIPKRDEFISDVSKNKKAT